MSLSEAQFSWLHSMRDDWWHTMGTPGSAESHQAFPPLPALSMEHVANARLLPDREHLLRVLPKETPVAELGTLAGGSAEQILAISNPSELHLFDLDFTLLQQRASGPLDLRVTLHEGDSSTMLAALPDEHFGWIYIDGDHSYDGVRKDIEVAVRKVRHDGFLVFNDYIYWSYLDQFPYGVPRAVNEMCLNDGWEFIYFVLHDQMYCDVVLKRRTDNHF